MAILTVMVSLALLMIIVSDLSTKEHLRYRLAINERDALQAEALAQSGANFSQLILMVQEPVQIYMANLAKMGMQMPTYLSWDLVPINGLIVGGLTDGSYFPDVNALLGQGDKSEPEKKTLISETKSEEIETRGPYKVPPGGYGGFRGRFSTVVEDEERKISLRKWPKTQFFKRKLIADQIYWVLSQKKYEPLFSGSLSANKNITPSQLIANIYDYVSEEDRSLDVSAPKESFGKDLLGDKRAQYVDTPDILPKRAPMDSLAELRLVPGVTDGIYQVLSKILTIYGETDAINILSASDEVLGSLFYLCAKNRESSRIHQLGLADQLITSWNNKKNEGGLEITVDGIVKHLEENSIEADKEECGKVVGYESKNFTIKSTATVGSVTKTLLVRLRSAGGIMTLYQFQYL